MNRGKDFPEFVQEAAKHFSVRWEILEMALADMEFFYGQRFTPTQEDVDAAFESLAKHSGRTVRRK
jgi:hypothetical protein